MGSPLIHITFPTDEEISPAKCLDGQVSLISSTYFQAGGFSEIYLGTWTKPSGIKQDVALKVFRGAHTNKTVLDVATRRINRESHLWVLLRHQNVLPIYGICRDLLPSPALVSPFCLYGTVSDYLLQNKRLNRMKIIYDIANGLAYLHANDVIHGDLKTTNVLVDSQGQAKICDFGCSKIVELTGFSTGLSQAYRYMAPELILSDEPRLSQEADVYAFAMVVLEVLTDKKPFYYVSDPQVTLSLHRGRRPVRERYDPWHIPSGSGDWIWGLLEAGWQQNPTDRPQMGLISKRLAERVASMSRTE